MLISLKNYTLRYLIVAFLVILALWALLFYAYILDEVYDNVDDGLKNQKIEILREIYKDPQLLNTREFGISQFRILPAKEQEPLFEKSKLTNEFFYMPYDEEEEPYRVLTTGFYDKDGNSHLLQIRTSTVEEDDFILNLATALGVLYVILVASVFAINRFVLHKALKPFETIIQSLNNYRFGNKAPLQSITTNVAEFDLLNSQITNMIKRNEEVFDEQKLFIENASHELQTPLAITINKLEMLMEDNSLSEAQLVQLEESKSALMRMVNLNKSLLMLSRIENKQYKDVEQVDFNELTNMLKDELEDLLKFKNISLNIEQKDHFKVLVNKDLATVLLSNLFRNAIKYNIEHGEINISISSNEWRIENTGIGISLDKKLIFRRFHKGTQSSNSNGLGLSIVKSVIDSYPQLSIKYSHEQNKHVFLIAHTHS